jgi:hypothetical protein
MVSPRRGSAHERRSRARIAAGCFVVAAGMIVRLAGAAEPPAASVEESAKALFYEGVALLDQGDPGRALAAFQRSRELFPGYQNTHNIVFCLKRLGRHDEALTMYEDARERLGVQLKPEERAEIEASITQLKTRVGDLVITTELRGDLFVDGRQRGELPRRAPLRVLVGAHTIRVIAAGYELFERVVSVPAGTVVLFEPALLPLARRLPPPIGAAAAPETTPLRGWFGEAYVGYALGSSLGSDAERNAASRCQDDCALARGPWLGLRIGRRFANGLAAELGGGYLGLSSTFRREVPSAFRDGSVGAPIAVTFRLKDEVQLHGGFVAAGGSYQKQLSPRLQLLLRVSVGALIARSDEPATAATATTMAGNSASFKVAGPPTAPAMLPVILPEIGVRASWHHLNAGVAMGLFFSPIVGPRFDRGRVFEVADRGLCRRANDAACAPDITLPRERAFGPFVAGVPQITAGYDF